MINHDSKSAICVNSDKPPQRILFSLTHEICHLLFDRDKQLPVDVFLPSLHWKAEIDDEQLPEFFANKFAQFSLIPYEDALPIAQKYPQFDLVECQQAVDKGRTLKEVLTNVIFDVLSCNPDLFDYQRSIKDEHNDYGPVGDQFRRMDYEEGRDRESFETLDRRGKRSFINYRKIQNAVSGITPSLRAKQIFPFLNSCRKQLASCIKLEVKSYSDEIIDYIEGILQIELR